MGIVEKARESLLDNVDNMLITPITDKFIEPIKETIEESSYKNIKRNIIKEIYKDGLKSYGNELFFDPFQKDFLNDNSLSNIYDSLFNSLNSEELDSINKVVNHFYKPEHYDAKCRNSAKSAILDVVNRIFYTINKPTNHSEQIIQNVIQNNSSQIVASINENAAMLNKIMQSINDIKRCQNINIEQFSISSEEDTSEIQSLNNDKKPKNITIYIYNKFYNITSDTNSLFAFLEFSGQEQSFDIIKHIISYDDNTTTEEIINPEINDHVISFQMPYCDEIVKSTKIVIKPPRTEYSISIETSDHEIIVPNYNVYFTRERNGDIINTTWNDISVDSNVIINFIVSFSSHTKETTKFKFNINAKNPEDVYSQYHYYKVLDMFKKSDKIIFRDNFTHNILLETATLNVNISNEDLNFFIKLYNNALWVQDKYNIGFTVPEEVCYEDYITLEMLRNIKEKRYYIFPKNFQINCIVPYDENYEKQNEIDNEQLYTAGYESKYIDIWDTHINFAPDEPLRMILSCANIEKTTDGIKVTSTGTIYATTADKSGDQLFKINDISQN